MPAHPNGLSGMCAMWFSAFVPEPARVRNSSCQGCNTNFMRLQMTVVMEKQQHLESAVDHQSRLINGFLQDRQTQLFYLRMARLNIFTLRDLDVRLILSIIPAYPLAKIVPSQAVAAIARLKPRRLKAPAAIRRMFLIRSRLFGGIDWFIIKRGMGRAECGLSWPFVTARQPRRI